MTETEMKLWDAATQMKLALADSASEDVVRSCVNAFISNARSVTLVMQVESSEHPDLVNWYAQESKGFGDSPLLKFFNAKRVHTIHKGVVQTKAHSMPILTFSMNGEPPRPGNGATATILLFDEIERYLPGDNGGVFRLCEKYFLFLRTLVSRWLRKRYLLGVSVGESLLFPPIRRARMIAGVSYGHFY